MRDNLTAHSARDYDREILRTIPHYETMHAEVLDLVRTVHPAPATWLDTGCGTGSLVARALPLFPSTHFVLADPSEAMLAQARGRLGLHERVSWRPAGGTQDVELSGFPSPQVITAILCHHYLLSDARERSLARCHALLPEGGLFVSIENAAPSTAQGLTIGLDRWRRFQIAQGKTREAVAKHLERFGTHLFPISLEAHLALLRRVGFGIVEPFWLAGMQAGVYAIRA